MVRAFTAADVLSVWERGVRRNSGGRGLAILAVACPELDPNVLAGLTVGRRDALLLDARELAFGSELAATARLPGLRRGVGVHRTDKRPATARRGAGRRAPAAADRLGIVPVVAAGQPGDFPTADRGRPGSPSAICQVARRRSGRCWPGACWPPTWMESPLRGAAASRGCGGRSDRRNRGCGCGERSAGGDPAEPGVSGLWSWLAGAFRHCRFLLGGDCVSGQTTVTRSGYVLARAYGWREADILALTAARRQGYVEMVQG